MKVISNYTLDFSPGGVPLVIPVSQYDANSRQLVFTPVDSRGVFDWSDHSGYQKKVYVRGTKPDGNAFDYEITEDGNTIVVLVTEQMAAVAGDVMCEVYLVCKPGGDDPDEQVASANFILRVERAAMDKDTIPSTSEIRQLVDIIDRTDEIIEAAETVESAVAQVDADAAAAAASATAAAGSASSASTDAATAASAAASASADALTATASATAASASAERAAAAADAAEEAAAASGLTPEAQAAMMALLRHIAYTDGHGQDYIDALMIALEVYTPVSITAAYDPYDTVVVGDSLERLRGGMTVTATYEGGATGRVRNYTLSGTLAAGSNTITVSYKGLTATLSVTAVALPTGYMRVSAVVADGTQYIASGLKETDVDDLGYVARVVRHATTGLNGAGHIFSAKTIYFPALRNSSTDEHVLSGNRSGNTGGISSGAWVAGTAYLIEAYMSGGDAIRLNGEEVATVTKGSSTPLATNELTFFAVGSNPTVERFRFHGEFYYMRLYNGSTLAHDYIPVLNANSVAGLYDTVAGAFLAPTAGTLDYIA